MGKTGKKKDDKNTKEDKVPGVDVSKLSKRALSKYNMELQKERKEKNLVKKEKRKRRMARKKEELVVVNQEEHVVEFVKKKDLKRKFGENGDKQGQGSDSEREDEEEVVQPTKTEIKKTRKEKKRQEEIENKMWKSFDRKLEEQQANELFSEYYRSQFTFSEEQWKAFLKSAAKGLLVTFRLNKGRHPLVTASLTKRLQSEFRFAGRFVRVGVDKILSSSEVVNPNESIEHVWQLGTDRLGFSKAKELAPLHQTMDREAKLGHLARQGIASMIPAIVLQPKPTDLVLDMCAAPGSKSEQVLQMMGSDDVGALVTNDSDPKRLSSLKKRFQMIGQRNHMIVCSRGEDLAAALGTNVFDKIICDVPCSGDGTIRKYPHIWRRWRARHGALIHELQLDLLKSAASLLKVGGRMVYSTCSINPIEDEAVVASLLQQSGGAFRLVEIESFAPSSNDGKQTSTSTPFVGHQGLETWVCSEDLMNKGSKTEYDQALKKKNKKRKVDLRVKVLDTMLPPEPKVAKALKLNRCMRILHHDNDTEGFFLALIEKVKPWEHHDPSLRSKAESKDLLRKVGFNPQNSTDTSRFVDLLQPLENVPPVVETMLKTQFGLDEMDKIHLQQKRHNKDEDKPRSELVISLMSEKVAQMLRLTKQSRNVQVLQAGVDIATAPIITNDDMNGIGGLTPCAKGALEIVAANGGKSWVVPCNDPADHFSLLQLLLMTRNEQEITEGDVFRIPIEQCVDILEEDEEDDDEEDDRDGNGYEIIEALEELPIGHSICIALPLQHEAVQQLYMSAQKQPVQQVKEEPPKKLSIAERKRLKKMKKNGKTPPSSSFTSSSSSSSSAEGNHEGERRKVNMFDNTCKEKFTLPLVFQKDSAKTLVILTEPERIMSFGQTLETLLNAEE